MSGFTVRGSLLKAVQGSALLSISGNHFKIKKLGKETTQDGSVSDRGPPARRSLTGSASDSKCVA